MGEHALPVKPMRGDALLVVDVQNDFLPGGSLPVPSGDEVIPVLNDYLQAFARARLPVFATRDWHPADHCSFQSQGGPWPSHCVRETKGGEFAPALQLPASAFIISKASAPGQEAYSGFQNTDLAERLRRADISRLCIGGLATDYCVLNTVKDALREGFKVLLLTDAIRPVNVHANDGLAAEAEMLRLGAVPIKSEQR